MLGILAVHGGVGYRGVAACRLHVKNVGCSTRNDLGPRWLTLLTFPLFWRSFQSSSKRLLQRRSQHQKARTELQCHWRGILQALNSVGRSWESPGAASSWPALLKAG